MPNWGSNLLKRVGTKVRPSLQLALREPFTLQTEKDLYRKVLNTPESDEPHAPVTLHPACLGGHSILCRPGTRDKSSLDDLLFHQVYLPPKPLHQPRVIVDLGSNVGYTVAHFAFLYPSAKVIGLELDPGNYALALKNVEPWKDRVSLINAAIWSSDGDVVFGGHGEDAFRVLSPANDSPAQANQPKARLAKSVTMPSLMRDHGVSRIDYLKMDIEGGEAELVLNADCSWMEQVDAMKIELHHLDYGDFERALTARGFHCYPDKREWTCIVALRG
jgi:FkbM family methyltransferase